MGFLEERDLTDVPTIPEFYTGKTIFITGGSGFIGKVLIEKLLYSCEGLARIYLLLRSKKGDKPEYRLAKLYASPAFDRLRIERPGVFESKVFVVAGDVMESNLGMSGRDRELMVNQVNIIFHVAASVRFDDTLKYAVQMNLKSTIDMIAFAKEMKNLCVFVHVSTSYSNTNRDPIDEILYPPLADWRETLAVCTNTDDYTLKILTPKYLGDIPNTYTFTKQLAEHVVCENKGQLPIIIVRPSIVISSISEPCAGYIENFNGPVGIFIACGKGIMRIVLADPDIISDFIPVDACTRHLAAAAWIRGTKKLESTDDIEIYNCCAGNLNHIGCGDLVQLSKFVGAEVPLDGMIWNAGGRTTTSEFLYYILFIVQQLLPAFLVDSLLRVLGQKPMLVKIQRRIYTASMALKYYTSQQWTFKNTNFVSLRSSLKQQDRDAFYYDLENLSIPTYFTSCCYGGRRFLLKEKDEDIPAAKRHFRRMVMLDKATQITFFALIFFWVILKFVQYYNSYLVINIDS